MAEDSKSTADSDAVDHLLHAPDAGDHFLDADDDFPFFDFPQSQSQSSSSPPDPNPIDLDPIPLPSSPSSGLRRRRRRCSSTSHQRNHTSVSSSSSSSIDDQLGSVIDHTTTTTTGNREISEDFENPSVNVAEQSDERVTEDSSTLTTVDRIGDLDADGEVSTTSERENEGEVTRVLVKLSSFLIKAIGFQFSLLFSFITFPFWVTYSSYMFIVDPIGAIRRVRGYIRGIMMRTWGVGVGMMSPFFSKWFKENKSLLDVLMRVGWGLVWSVYVGAVLVGLLGSGFLVGGVVMRSVVEEPFRVGKELNFDYTKSSPVAFVPISSGCCGGDCVGRGLGGSDGMGRVIPSNQNLRATLEMRLPESDYNRRLGMFQVKIEFLAANGKPLASSRHPCLLHFKSDPIRMLLTVFKIIPLVAGYVSESQTLKLNFKGLAVDAVPTACLKVTIEQRAEYRTGAGIPELYDAFLLVESELPFLKRILWYWKTTIYVWFSMTVFMVELLFALVCCRPLLIPRFRLRSGAAAHGAPWVP